MKQFMWHENDMYVCDQNVHGIYNVFVNLFPKLFVKKFNLIKLVIIEKKKHTHLPSSTNNRSNIQLLIKSTQIT